MMLRSVIGTFAGEGEYNQEEGKYKPIMAIMAPSTLYLRDFFILSTHFLREASVFFALAEGKSPGEVLRDSVDFGYPSVYVWIPLHFPRMAPK